MKKTYLIAAAFAVSATVLSIGVASSTPTPPGTAGRDLAVILSAPGEDPTLRVVDLERFELVRTVALRSLALDMDSAPFSRTVLTAQSGGPGKDADDVYAIFSPDGRGGARYERLPSPNPGDIAVTSTGSAVVTHGVLDSEGLRATAVSPRGLTTAFHVPDGASRLVVHGETVLVPWSSVTMADDEQSHSALLRVDGSAVSTVADLRMERPVVVQGDSGQTATIAGVRPDHLDTLVLQRLSLSTGKVQDQGLIEGLDRGPASACVVGDEIAVVDADGVDPERPGRGIVVVDSETLSETRRITVEGMPAAIAAWGDRLLVFDSKAGRLLEYAPGALTPSRRLDIGTPGLIGGDLCVLPRLDSRGSTAGGGVRR